MLGIMAGMDQEAWFAGFDVVPRAVLLLVSQAPDARHHGRLGPQDSVEVHRCSSWTRFFSMPVVVLRVSWSRQCFTQWRFRSCSSSRSSLLFSRCVPFHCRQARVAKRLHCLDHCWRCSSWTSCSRPSLYNARCRLCPGSAQRCPWRHYRCSSWTRSWSLRQMPWPRQCAVHVLFKVVDFLIVALRQFPVVLVRLPSCFSLVVGVPVVLMQQVVPCPW